MRLRLLGEKGMKEMKRLLCLLLAALMLGSLLVGCSNKKTPEEPTAEPGSSSDDASILAEQLAGYAVVRSSVAGKSVLSATTDFVTKLNSLYGLSLKAKNDNDSADREIIIGTADREEVAQFLTGMRANDWGYGIVGNKLIIAGVSEEGTLLALSAFTEKYLTEANTVFFSNKENAYTFISTYELDQVTLNGADLRDYTVVYPADNLHGEESIAVLLRSTMLERYGYSVAVARDSAFTGGNAIYIGDCKQVTDEMKQARDATLPTDLTEKKYYIVGSDGMVWVDSNDDKALSVGIQALCNNMKADANKTCTLTVGTGEAKEAVKTSVSSMSFNISYEFNKTKPSEITRAERVVEIVRTYQPDTVGFQEANPDWMEYLSEKLGDIYGWVGEHRIGNGKQNDEANPVFYKKSKFELVDNGTYWLSTSPTTKNSKYPGASLPRIMTYAILQDKATGEKIVHINTHLGTEDSDIRKGQISVIQKMVEAKKLTKYPFVLTGDLNASNTSYFDEMFGQLGCVNSTRVTESGTTTTETFPGGHCVIDYLYITKASTGVKSYQVCVAEYENTRVSDHNAILINWYTLNVNG